MSKGFHFLEALSVNNGSSRLIIILILRNPHLLESGEGGHDGATNPILALTQPFP